MHVPRTIFSWNIGRSISQYRKTYKRLRQQTLLVSAAEAVRHTIDRRSLSAARVALDGRRGVAVLCRLLNSLLSWIGNEEFSVISAELNGTRYGSVVLSRCVPEHSDIFINGIRASFSGFLTSVVVLH